MMEFESNRDSQWFDVLLTSQQRATPSYLSSIDFCLCLRTLIEENSTGHRLKSKVYATFLKTPAKSMLKRKAQLRSS